MKFWKLVLGVLIVLASLWLIRIGLITFSQESIDYTDGVPVDSKTHNEGYARVIGAVSEQLNDHRLALDAPSVSVAVAIAGELVWAEARGYASLEEKETATVDTAYAIASVSKPITAALVAALWEKNVLDLDADVRRYVPDFPQKAFPITVRQLLSHQAGIRDFEFAWIFPAFTESLRNEQFDSIRESLVIFENDELLFEPDTSFHYSTYGYTLISAAVEGATGQPFLESLDEHVFEPLRMDRSGADDGTGASASKYFVVSDDHVIPASKTNSSYKWAGGGLVSSPTDLARFGAAMLRHRLLTETTTDIVFSPRKTRDGEINPQRYGLGWRVGNIFYGSGERQLEEAPVFWHSGWGPGYISVLQLLPEQDIVVAMVANVSGENGSVALIRIAASIAREFVDFQNGPEEAL